MPALAWVGYTSFPAGRVGLEVGETEGTCISMEAVLPLVTAMPADGKVAAMLSTRLCSDLALGTVVS